MIPRSSLTAKYSKFKWPLTCQTISLDILATDTHIYIRIVDRESYSHSETLRLPRLCTNLTTASKLPVILKNFKHSKWKLNGFTCRSSSSWRIRCWTGNSLQQSAAPKVTRNISANMFKMQVYSSGAKASDCVWPPLLQAVHWTTDKWRVSFTRIMCVYHMHLMCLSYVLCSWVAYIIDLCHLCHESSVVWEADTGAADCVLILPRNLYSYLLLFVSCSGSTRCCALWYSL